MPAPAGLLVHVIGAVEQTVRVGVGVEQRLDAGAQGRVAGTLPVQVRGPVEGVGELDGGEEGGLNAGGVGRHGWSSGGASPHHAPSGFGAVEEK